MTLAPAGHGQARYGSFAIGGARWSLTEQPDEAAAERVIRTAVDSGVSLIDTAAAYCPPGPGRGRHNERLIGRVAEALRAEGAPPLRIATKGGHARLPDGEFYIDGSRDTLRRHCFESLDALGVERIDLFQLHWPDPNVELEESLEALAELRDEQVIDEIGVCNVSVEQVERARAVAPVSTVQNGFSVVDQRCADLVGYCDEHSLTFLAYSPFGGPDGLAMRDPSATSETHDGLLRRLHSTASDHRVTEHEMAIAWMLQRAPCLVPIIGAGRPASVLSARSGAAIELSAREGSGLTIPC